MVDLMPPPNPYHLLLGIAPRNAAPDHYQFLGIDRLEMNADVIGSAAVRQCDHLHRHATGEFAAGIPALERRILAARDCLLDPTSHCQYAWELQGFQGAAGDPLSQAERRGFDTEFQQNWQLAQQSELDPLHLWLGISRHQRPASNHRLLGVAAGEQDPVVIRNAAERQIAFVRKFAIGAQSDQANALLRQLGRARATLLRGNPASDPPVDQPAGQHIRFDDAELTLSPALPPTRSVAAHYAVPSGFAPPGSSPGRRLPRSRTQPRSRILFSALAWMVPFLLPSAVIFGYIKWTEARSQRSTAAVVPAPTPLSLLEPKRDSPSDPAPEIDTERTPRSQHGALNNHAKPSLDGSRDRREMKPASTVPPRKVLTPPKPPVVPSPPESAATVEDPAQKTPPAPRWRLRNDETFEATVVTIDRDHVVLKVTETGQERIFQYEEFVAEDQRTLRIQCFDNQDRMQLADLDEFIQRLPTLPEEANKLQQLHEQSDQEQGDSPYAGLWAAVVLSEVTNEPAKAKKLLDEVIERIEKQQQYDDSRHLMTLASALNNRAVCQIMSDDVSPAANSLADSLNTIPIPSEVVTHNAQLMLKNVEEKRLRPSAVVSRKLKLALGNQPNKTMNLRASGYYVLDIDLPPPITSANNAASKYLHDQLKRADALAVRQTVCLVCKGSELVGCKCKTGKISVRRLVPNGRNRLTNEVEMVEKVFTQKCSNCNGNKQVLCSACRRGRVP
jgi:hypothetical protein